MATFKIVLDRRIKIDDEKYHLTVRVSNKKDILYLRFGIVMTVKEFDSIFNKKSFDSNIDTVKKRYQKYVDRAEKIFPLVIPYDSTKFRGLYFDTKFDPDTFSSQANKENGSIKYMYENYLKIKLESGQISMGTEEVYSYNMRALLRFKPKLSYQDVTPEFLSSFEYWFTSTKNLRGKFNSLATVGNICRSLRSVLNYYKKKKIIPLTYEYPFLDYKVPNFIPPKMVISNNEIQSIIDCKEFDDLWEEYSRDIWVLLYRMNGINFVDILKMRWDNKLGDLFVFIRHKTRKTRRNNIRPIRVRISDKIQSSLDKIGDMDSPFVLGLINQEDYSEIYLKNRNKKLKSKINLYLKKVGKRLNLSMSLDISLARDAYANTLKRANVNPLKISENMNHSDPRTTTLHYLDQFDQDTLDDANDAVL